jgi:hypothetical protein
MKAFPVIVLNTRYRSPAGVSCTPIDFANNGWIVRFTGANFAFDRFVSDADFAAYEREGN